MTDNNAVSTLTNNSVSFDISGLRHFEEGDKIKEKTKTKITKKATKTTTSKKKSTEIDPLKISDKT